jgi:hypothetical protein
MSSGVMFTSWLVSLGAPVAWVSESLGHSNWAVTARHHPRWVDDAAVGSSLWS